MGILKIKREKASTPCSLDSLLRKNVAKLVNTDDTSSLENVPPIILSSIEGIIKTINRNLPIYSARHSEIKYSIKQHDNEIYLQIEISKEHLFPIIVSLLLSQDDNGRKVLYNYWLYTEYVDPENTNKKEIHYHPIIRKNKAIYGIKIDSIHKENNNTLCFSLKNGYSILVTLRDVHNIGIINLNKKEVLYVDFKK